jgi:hypothetical protein
MRYYTPELSTQEVLRHTQALLEEHLTLNVEGDRCAMDNLFKVLVGVAAREGDDRADSWCARAPQRHPV